MEKNLDTTPTKPVSEYLVNGPIPPDELVDLDFLSSYMDMGIIDWIWDVHFMLEYTCIHGAPKWWKGTVSEFEEEFHNNYQDPNTKLDWNSDFVWHAAEHEVRAGRLSPLPEDATNEQVKTYLLQGMRLLKQTWAVETLMDMWVENRNREMRDE